MKEAPTLTDFPTKASPAGKAAFVLALVMIFSTNSQYRIGLAGLLVHPYLLLAPLLVVFVPVSIFKVQGRVLNPLMVFFVIFALALLQDPSPLGEIFKIAAGIFTLLFFARSVNSPRDYQLIGFALLAVALYVAGTAAFKGASGNYSRLAGINALEGIGNKNAQSLFTLPGLFYATTILPGLYKNKKWTRFTFFISCIAILLVGTLLSANRSGWLAAFLVILWGLYGFGLSIRTLFISGVFVIIGYFAVQNFAQDIVEHKVDQTVEGYSSDAKRQDLIIQSMLIGLENPVLGRGFIGMHTELATRVKSYGAPIIDSHNVYGYLLGAGGVITFSAFFIMLFSLSRKYNTPQSFLPYEIRYVKHARYLMMGFVLVFLARAFFTRELLYSPTFLAMMGTLYSNLQMNYQRGYIEWQQDQAAAEEAEMEEQALTEKAS